MAGCEHPFVLLSHALLYWVTSDKRTPHTKLRYQIQTLQTPICDDRALIRQYMHDALQETSQLPAFISLA